MAEEQYIVYAHIGTKLIETTTRAYSPAQAAYNINKRYREKRYKNYGVDGTMTMAREEELNSPRFGEL